MKTHLMLSCAPIVFLIVIGSTAFGQQSSYTYDPSGNTIGVAPTASSSPVIEAQPENQVFQTNGIESFSAVASGVGLTYQWLSNGVAIAGATGDTLWFTNLPAAPSGSFSVVISNASGVVTSTPVAIWLNSNSPSTNSVSSSTNLVANPGFELGTNGWTFTGDAGVTTSPHTGSLDAYVNIASGSVAQAITTTSGSVYVVSFWLSANGFSSSATITASFGSTTGFAKSYGSGAFGYQQQTFTAQATGTNTLFIFSGVMNGGTFFLDDVSVILTNSGQMPPFTPIITPVSELVGSGTNATFTVTASGSPPLSYQWQFDGTNLMNGGNIVVSPAGTLTVSNVTAANDGIYSVTVSNAYGAASSADAVLTFSTNAISPPANLVTNPGFELGTDGWTFTGDGGWDNHDLAHTGNAEAYVNIASGSVSQTIATTSGSVYVVSFWLSANGFSSSATIMASFGSTTGFAKSYGSGAFGYQLQSFTAQATGTTTVFTFSGVMNGGTFFLDDVSIVPTVQVAPQISIQPTSQLVVPGDTTAFSVGVAGLTPLRYQWQFDGVNLAGATNSTLILNAVAITDAGNYDVVITNAYGSVTSTTATLSVLGVLPVFQAWQLQYFGCTNSGSLCPQAAANADPYGKGISNTNQFLAGLNPTNPASVFRIVAISQAGVTNKVTWKTSGGDVNAALFNGPTVITNIVQGSVGTASSEYSNNFTDISGPLIIVPPGDTVTNYPDASGTNHYYRIRLGP